MHAEKALDNTPGIFLIKVFTKQGIARKIPILIKDTSQKHIANTTLNDKTEEQKEKWRTGHQKIYGKFRNIFPKRKLGQNF